MKAFGDASFFRTFDRLLFECGQAIHGTHWSYADVQWTRHRHSFTSDYYGFSVDTYRLSKPPPNAWVFLVVKEFWWAPDGTAHRSNHWAKPLTPDKLQIRRWMDEANARLLPAGSRD